MYDNENSCRCSGFDGEGRRFFTKAEKIEFLSEYKEQLQKELKGIEERIKVLEKNA